MVKLYISSDLAPVVERIVNDVVNTLRHAAPGADIQHIGATAVPGAVTKGDIDLTVRTTAGQFAAVVERLRPHFAVKQPENWSADFASFGDDERWELPVGVQVAVIDSPSDVFVKFRDYLRSNAAALSGYNELKRRHADDEGDGYWLAKNAFFEGLLSRQQPWD